MDSNRPDVPGRTWLAEETTPGGALSAWSLQRATLPQRPKLPGGGTFLTIGINRPPLYADHVGEMSQRPAQFYSQHGEDVIAWKALGRGGGPRYFVEVGVIDGVRFSNTLALEQCGWRGLCVEAHPRFAQLARQNRPGSTVIHAAAGDRCATVPFHADPRGDLSSLHARDSAEMRRRFGDDFRGFELVDVHVRTLNDMLYQADAPRDIELVSIDVEGAEEAALRGLDFDYWRPRMVIVEADDGAARRRLTEMMGRRRYRLARRVGVNLVFCRGLLDAWRVRLARVSCPVVHTGNPADERPSDRRVLPSAYETRLQFVRRLAGAAP